MRLLVIPIVVALLCGCAGNKAPDPATVTVALDPPPTNLDPRVAQDATSQRLIQLIFSSLVRKNEHFEIEPDLAERWETPNATTYIFYLRQGVKFHDGRPFTARDVVYTFRSLLDGSISTAKTGTFRLIESIRAPDDRTVIFTLKEPFAPFLWNLTGGAIAIVPDGAGPDFASKLTGTGPFALVHYIQDVEVLLKRNDSYYGEKPTVPAVRFKIIPEAIVRALELRKGTVDMALNVLTPDIVEALRGDSRLDVMTAPGTRYQYIAFNLQDPVFRDIRVRQAIAYAIDRESIVKYLWRNQARPASGVIPITSWAYESNVKTYAYDPDRARQLLKEAGHPNLSFTFRTSSEDEARLLAAALQQQLQEVGIRMQIRSNEFATFFADVVSGNFQAYSLRWIGSDDPDIFNLIFHSKRVPPNGANRGHYSNPEVDRLIDFSRRELDRDKRREAYKRIQQIVAEELPYVSLFYLDNVCVYNRRIQGMRLYPAGEYGFLTRITVEPLEELHAGFPVLEFGHLR
jgi:peptide/nickel transport system substrate-binding protein